jgi:DNA (cytosine-5)-methyltransferase 1
MNMNKKFSNKCNNNYPVLSLFCGAGGMDMGFEEHGFIAELAIDYDKAAVESYNQNAKKPRAMQLDLSKNYGIKLVSLYKEVTGGHLPIGVIGGPPCQGFSLSNWRADGSDPRNQLPYRFIDTLRAFNAESPIHFFLFENVIGLKTAKHIGRFNRIKKKFNDVGFNVFEQEINAVDFGVAQSRKRLFLVGLNRNIYEGFNFRFPKAGSDRVNVGNVIKDLPAPAFFSHGLDRSSIPHHINHWTMQPRSHRFKTGEFGDGRSFRKLNWNEPSPTVAYGHREIHVHPDGKRRLSIYEAMLLQGFPEKKFELAGTLSEQVTQVSNAVPPPVAGAIAKTIRATLNLNMLAG